MSDNTIQDAKKDLEHKIIQMPDVFGIGTKFDGQSYFIEVAVKDKKTEQQILKLLTNGKWSNYDVRIIIREQSKI